MALDVVVVLVVGQLELELVRIRVVAPRMVRVRLDVRLPGALVPPAGSRALPPLCPPCPSPRLSWQSSTRRRRREESSLLLFKSARAAAILPGMLLPERLMEHLAPFHGVLVNANLRRLQLAWAGSITASGAMRLRSRSSPITRAAQQQSEFSWPSACCPRPLVAPFSSVSGRPSQPCTRDDLDRPDPCRRARLAPESLRWRALPPS